MSVGTAHGSIDGKPMATEITLESLQALYEVLASEPKKSHVLHGDDHAPTNPIGIFSGFYLDMQSDPVTLRASQFESFRAFRENSKREFETMFELAEVAPGDMAISADFDLTLQDRGDLPPVVIPTSVRSFDFVNEGAATNGLFCKKTVDTSPASVQVAPVIETHSHLNKTKLNPILIMRQVFAHFSKRPAALPHIAKFAETMPEDAKPEDVIAKVEMSLSEEEQAALIAERDEYKKQVAELSARLAELEPKQTELAALNAKHAELSKKADDQAVEIEGYKKSRARFGFTPIKTGAPAADTAAAPVCTKAEFSAKTPAEKSEFSMKGGRISD
jgi:hypothetical protein